MTSGVSDTLLGNDKALELWSAIPCNAFVSLQSTNTFARSHPLVIMKTRQMIDGVSMVEHDMGAFSFCRLALIACGGVPCAYVITSSRCRTRIRDRYCTMSASGQPSQEATTLFTDGTLGMVGDDNAVVLFTHQRFWMG